ncbi:hypothetical protein IEQ34_005562 [Dendrobium chrysotoxum]|uniref:Uncharacterized protein n=1 Tax=Dendrobium chrysotoxum TaxID=161865 RepID=A0AAV7HBH3_DENCH|nr:hypothetical protein IEQ34_005562 [Dendrobium chrysotoxum]
MGDPTSSKNLLEDRPAHQSEGPKKIHKTPKTDDVISTITEDSFISFRKKFHFPNDLVMKVPARSDRARFPPPGYVTVYEFSLRARLRFPPSPELIDILTIYGVILSQFFYRAMSIVMGLIVLFRDRRVVLSAECLSRMGRLFSDWLDICTRDPSKGWISDFFYVQNDWKLQEKWGKLKEFPVPLHIRAEDLLKILKLPDLDALHYEVRYLSRYIDEEYLFEVGLYTQAGRSSAQMLKRSVKAVEAVPQKNQSKRPGSGSNLQAPKKKKADEILTVTSKGPPVSPSKSYIPEDHLEMNKILNDWNNEFVKVKYLQGEYKEKYDGKVKDMKVVEDQLAECRAELTNMITSASSQNEQIDRLHIELLPSAVIEEFKKSYAFKIIIEDHVQEACNHIYDVEVKALEAE